MILPGIGQVVIENPNHGNPLPLTHSNTSSTMSKQYDEQWDAMPISFRIQLALKEEERKALKKKPSKQGLGLKQSYLKKNFRTDLLSGVIDGTISEHRERLWKLRSGCLSAMSDKKNRSYFISLIEDFPPYPNPSLHQIELDLVRT